ncbi:MAG: gliding motility-associated C-terminal domain-containing protein [Bacteroidetes bacterium]|nr:gliding motility-associated C-terminal domain-containing protein [Bacteroidota bacterium]
MLLLLTRVGFAQYLPNPSFEGIPAPATAPPGWQICTPVWSTPDIQPGNFNVYMPPSDGNTYLGMTARNDFTWEDVHTSLNTPFAVDSCYTFKIDLAFQDDVNFLNMYPITLKIYGSNLSCDKSNLLWQSPAIANEEWETYEFIIKPEEYDITDIVLEAYYTGANPYWGYILMDNIRIYKSPSLDLGNDTTLTLCEGESLLINAGGGFASYLWSDGSNDSIISVDTTGYYWVDVIGNEGCDDTDTIFVEILEYEPMVSTMIDSTYICEGQQVLVTLEVEFGAEPYSFQWVGLDDTVSTVILTPDTTTTYLVNIIDKCGDTLTDSIKIIVLEEPDINLGGNIIICGGEDTTLNVGSGYFSYLWQDGSTDSTLTVSEPGLYWVQVIGFGGCQATDSVYVSFFPPIETALPSDTAICFDGSVLLNPGSGFITYLWYDNSTTPTITVNQPGTYWVTVTDQNGCLTTDTVEVNFSPAVVVNLGPDTTVCFGDNYPLTPGPGFQSYVWQNGQTSPYITITTSGTYWVEVVDIYGCTGADTVNIEVKPSPQVELGEDTTICADEVLLLEPVGQYTSYLWQDNSTLPFYTVTSSGIYSVTVTNTFNCEASDEIFVQVSNPEVAFAGDSLLCSGDTILLDAGSEYIEYQWQDGQEEQFYTVISGGTYSVNVVDQYGCQGFGEITVNEKAKPTAGLGDDKKLCEGETLVLEAPSGDFQYFWNGVDGTDTYVVSSEGLVSLEVTNECGTAVDEVFVSYAPIPAVNLGEDQVLVDGQSIVLNAGEGFDSYLWQDGTMGQFYEVNAGSLDPSNPNYFVEVSKDGCSNSDTTKIILFEVWVPRVITPNSDQKNDLFQPDLERWQGINKHHIEVFNRWGEKVWESEQFEEGWDGTRNGKTVADGTYYWVLEVYYGSNNIKQTVKGSLTVLGSETP